MKRLNRCCGVVEEDDKCVIGNIEFFLKHFIDIEQTLNRHSSPDHRENVSEYNYPF